MQSEGSVRKRWGSRVFIRHDDTPFSPMGRIGISFGIRTTKNGWSSFKPLQESVRPTSLQLEMEFGRKSQYPRKVDKWGRKCGVAERQI